MDLQPVKETKWDWMVPHSLLFLQAPGKQILLTTSPPIWPLTQSQMCFRICTWFECFVGAHGVSCKSFPAWLLFLTVIYQGPMLLCSALMARCIPLKATPLRSGPQDYSWVLKISYFSLVTASNTFINHQPWASYRGPFRDLANTRGSDLSSPPSRPTLWIFICLE